MSDATAFGQFLIGGLVGLVVVIVLTCVLYCCYTKRREKKRKKPPAQKRKRRPPNVISHLHGWVWLSAVVNIWCSGGIVHMVCCLQRSDKRSENGQSEQIGGALNKPNVENGH